MEADIALYPNVPPSDAYIDVELVPEPSQEPSSQQAPPPQQSQVSPSSSDRAIRNRISLYFWYALMYAFGLAYLRVAQYETSCTPWISMIYLDYVSVGLTMILYIWAWSHYRYHDSNLIEACQKEGCWVPALWGLWATNSLYVLIMYIVQLMAINDSPECLKFHYANGFILAFLNVVCLLVPSSHLGLTIMMSTPEQLQ